MKKAYIQPELLIVRTAHQLPLCVSGNDLLGDQTQLVKENPVVMPGQYDFNSFEGIFGFITGQ